MTEEIQDGIEAEVEAPEVVEDDTRKHLEEEARKYGWKPKEEFTLSPEGWVDADRFLELPSTQNKRLKDQIKEIQSESERAFNERIEKLERANKAAMQAALDAQKRAHERDLAQIRQAQRRAVEEGDTERFDQLEKQRVQAERQTFTAPQADPVAEYADKHEWMKDPFMFAQAQQLVDVGLRTGALRTADAVEQIKFAEERLKEYFPHKFAQPDPEPKPSKVDGGGIGGLKPKKGVASLPPEAMAAARDYVEQGIFKSVEEYAAAYHAQG